MLTVPKLHWPITGQETWRVTKYLSGLVNTISILPTKFEVNAMSDLAGNATKHPNSDGWVEEESFLCILARDIDQLKSGTGEQIRFREILHKGVPWSAKCLTSWSQRVWQTSSVLVQKQCYFMNKRCPTGKPQVLAWGPRSFHTKTGLILWFAPSQWETALRLSLAGHKPRISQTATQPCTNLVVIRLSVVCETWPPIGWHHTFVIGWYKYRLGFSLWWNSHRPDHDKSQLFYVHTAWFVSVRAC